VVTRASPAMTPVWNARVLTTTDSTRTGLVRRPYGWSGKMKGS
jgi:hypothetical protein